MAREGGRFACLRLRSARCANVSPAPKATYDDTIPAADRCRSNPGVSRLGTTW